MLQACFSSYLPYFIATVSFPFTYDNSLYDYHLTSLSATSTRWDLYFAFQEIQPHYSSYYFSELLRKSATVMENGCVITRFVKVSDPLTSQALENQNQSPCFHLEGHDNWALYCHSVLSWLLNVNTPCQKTDVVCSCGISEFHERVTEIQRRSMQAFVFGDVSWH